jgi:hypothetical protein
MTAAIGPRGFDWEREGRHIGASIGEYNVILVIGTDPFATGHVALGIARVQAGHRRVAVGDLFGDSPPIRDLVQTDDAHGLVDNFSYGVSFSKISYRIPDAGQLFVIPTGSEPPDYDELLQHPRWHRLAASFRDEQSLFVIAVPATAPHVETLVLAADGAVLVGERVSLEISVSRIIATLREPRVIKETPIVGIPKQETSKFPALWSQRARAAAAAGIVLTLVLAGTAGWLAYRPFADSGRSHARRPDCDTTARAGPQCNPNAAAGGLAIAPDSMRADSARPAPAAAMPATPTIPTVSNPADSATAAAYGVELMAAITQAGAILKVQTDGKSLPAATFAPAVIQGVRWYKVVSGAFSARSDADSLLAGLRRRKLLRGGESVVRLPYAFLIDSELPAGAVPGMVASYVDRGQPVYALRQSNGKAWLYVGAFESVEQASLYMESLRASGIQPVLVYRKGRPF